MRLNCVSQLLKWSYKIYWELTLVWNSRGEKRRVSIFVKILMSLRLLFLDQQTSEPDR